VSDPKGPGDDGPKAGLLKALLLVVAFVLLIGFCYAALVGG
jgi:hypothetical protein